MMLFIFAEKAGNVARPLHIASTSVDTGITDCDDRGQRNPDRYAPNYGAGFRQCCFYQFGWHLGITQIVVSTWKAGNKLFAMNVSPHHQKIFKMVEMSRFMPTIEERDLATYR
ncbi:MAG: anti-sigma factor antagonist [Kouleothrix sp.]